jgi:eukaryotic-like serine/threonine-protein kinase
MYRRLMSRSVSNAAIATLGLSLGLWAGFTALSVRARETGVNPNSLVGIDNEPLENGSKDASGNEQERSAAESEPEFITTNVGQIKLKRIPAGTFLMGSRAEDRQALPAEKPQHRVQITRSFYLGVYELTQAQYQAVMGTNPSFHSPTGGGKPKVAGESTDQHPVENVSWHDAVLFCNKVSQMEGIKPFYSIDGKNVRVPEWSGTGYRLPTEAEWEYACRAGTTTPFSFGDDQKSIGEHAWCLDNADSKTHPVGKKKPNNFGLFDMHGNVFELCWDWLGESYYKQSSALDPTGVERFGFKVSRGGSWNTLPRYCRSAHRQKSQDVIQLSYLGFRLALGQPRR